MAAWPYNTSAWKKLRAIKIASNPLCEACEKRGKFVSSKHVDHIKSIKSGGDPFPELSGLMALCHSCHSVKTNARDKAGGSGIAFPGCGVDGLPIDPSHSFYEGGIPPRRTRGCHPKIDA